MFKRKSNAFTLIELIATLVIMAIIALIVTPLVMNIIRKARISADKKSVDAYGRSIELAIAGYLMDNGSFPTSIEQLTIEYSGDEVVCSTTQLNSDSSVYLAECTVGGRSVDGYTYGSDKSPTYTAYTVGNQVTYNNVDYYVIKDSGAKESTVTLLKAEPLSVDEVNKYGEGYVNQYYKPFPDYEGFIVKGAENVNGYGGMAYYSSEHCYSYDKSECKNDYSSSSIKHVIDGWKNAKVSEAMEARLITKDEYEAMAEVETYETPTEQGQRLVPMYDWMFDVRYNYWTMTPYNDSTIDCWYVKNDANYGDGRITITAGVSKYDLVVRPVIVLPKSALTTH